VHGREDPAHPTFAEELAQLVPGRIRHSVRRMMADRAEVGSLA
jgi:hypothetical protein